MILEHLELQTFRNFLNLTFSFSPQGGIFYGKNGQGKTNLLEAVYLLGYPASFRGGLLRDTIHWEHGQAALHGEFHSGVYEKKRSRVIDREGPGRKKGWELPLPMVLFSPDDLSLIKEGARGRRAFLDEVLGQSDAAYAYELKMYEKALAQRNQLLLKAKLGERMSEEEFLLWEEQLAERGAALVAKRIELVSFLEASLSTCWQRWIAREREITVRYVAIVEGMSGEPWQLARALREGRSGDIARGRTGVGPHRDEVVITLAGHAAREHASQGEQRLLAFFLRLAERDWFFTKFSEPPILLLDDLFSELDQDVCLTIAQMLQQDHQMILTAVDHSYEVVRTAFSLPAFSVSQGEVLPAHEEVLA